MMSRVRGSASRIFAVCLYEISSLKIDSRPISINLCSYRKGTLWTENLFFPPLVGYKKGQSIVAPERIPCS